MVLGILLQAGGSSGLLMDLAANEKSVHTDFFNRKSITFALFFFISQLYEDDTEGFNFFGQHWLPLGIY